MGKLGIWKGGRGMLEGGFLARAECEVVMKIYLEMYRIAFLSK